MSTEKGEISFVGPGLIVAPLADRLPQTFGSIVCNFSRATTKDRSNRRIEANCEAIDEEKFDGSDCSDCSMKRAKNLLLYACCFCIGTTSVRQQGKVGEPTAVHLHLFSPHSSPSHARGPQSRGQEAWGDCRRRDKAT